jgi:uncharacterized protein (TIGR02147 family)
VSEEATFMISIFDYSEYRKYLEDYYDEKKTENTAFSYQSLASKAGFNNRGFAYNIVKGKKNLSPANCHRVSEALRHNRYEAEYFETLVAFNQARDVKEKNRCFEKLCHIKSRGRGFSKTQIMNKNQYEFYSRWYHSAVRSIIGMYKFKNDYKWLAKMVTPAITVRQAKKSIELLLALGMIVKQKNGAYGLTDTSITTGKEVVGLAVQNFHDECTGLAKNAIHSVSKDNRNITGLTLGISRKSYDRICEEIAEFQNEIMNIANNDEDADRAYQLNFHMFPISKADNERKNAP